MRNLQKILALALALIMSFSLVVTANAAFSDEADITDTYNEAVNVLSQLEVFKGYTDGTYQPQKSITRAEVAAIIYRIATGDVTDAQVSIYSDWNRFSDVHAGEWWAGYINYCANAEYIKGYGNGKFGPDDPVTGYEALAMILRAVGYGKMEGEFQGSDWAVQTAARANTLKVTKNVQNSALLNSAATRELVAELLFRSILVPTVEYNQFSGYTENNTTLAYESFGLEAIEGVVVANEYANLYDTEVLADGKTDLEEADGTVRHLEIGSELTDVGEARYAYIVDDPRGAKVLALEDTGSNNVFDNTTGEDQDISTTKKFKDVSGIDWNNVDEGTEFYVNFGRVGHYSCDQRLEFEVIFYTKAAFDSFATNYEKIAAYAAECDTDNSTKDDDWTVRTGTWTEANGEITLGGSENKATISNGAYVWPAGTNTYIRFNRIIRAEENITNEEMNILEGIFAAADEIAVNGLDRDKLSGDVYVGTKSNEKDTKEERDLSNTISFRKFKDEYINAEAWDRNFDDTANGEWLKIVDNDNDGKAEYAFKTEYFLDQVVRVSTKNDETKYQYRFLDVDDDDITVKYLTEEKLEVGSKVLYSLIDGKALIELPEVVTDTITSMSFKDETVTTKSGETYGQSGIYNKTELEEIITNMDEDVKYNMYLDKYGFIRAYELADGTQYALITELYPGSYRNGRYVKDTDLTVELKAGDEKIDEFNVLNNSSNDFDMRDVKGWGSINDWTDLGGYDSDYPLYGKVYQGVNVILQPATAHLSLGTENGPAMFNPAVTNVAKYVKTDDGVRINSAAKFAVNTKGDELWYVSDDETVKMSRSEWIEDKVEDGSYTSSTSAGAVFDQNVEDGTFEHVYSMDYVQLQDGVDIKENQWKWLTKAVSGKEVEEVYAVHDTEFYVVERSATNDRDRILHFVDYENVPEILNVESNIRAVYALAENTTANRAEKDYWVAEVIVVEVGSYIGGYDSISLFTRNPSQTSGTTKLMESLNNESADPRINVVPADYDWSRELTGEDNLGFYELRDTTNNEDGSITADSVSPIRTQYNDHGIYAGIVKSMNEVNSRGGYIVVDFTDGSGTKAASTEKVYTYNVPVYGINNKTIKEITLDNEAQYSDVQVGDYIIWVENGKDNEAYIVDVTSHNEHTEWTTPSWLYNSTGAIDSEWEYIWNEQNNPATASETTVTFYGVKDSDDGAIDNTITVSYKAAKEYVDAYGAESVLSVQPTQISKEIKLNAAGDTYTAVINGKIYTLVQLKQDTKFGELYSTNESWAIVTNPANGNSKLYVKDADITIKTLQDILKSNEVRYDVTVEAFDKGGNPMDGKDLVAAMWTLEVTMTNASGETSKVTFTQAASGDYANTLVINSSPTISGFAKLTLNDGVKAYYYRDGAKGAEIKSGSYVEENINVYFTHEGYGVFDGAGIGLTTADGREVDGDESSPLYAVRNIGTGDNTVGFTVATPINAAASFEGVAGKTTIEKIDDTHFTVWAKPQTPGNGWYLNLWDMTTHSPKNDNWPNWIGASITTGHAAADRANPTKAFEWINVDLGTFMYRVSGENGGTDVTYHFTIKDIESDLSDDTGITKILGYGAGDAASGTPPKYAVDVAKTVDQITVDDIEVLEGCTKSALYKTHTAGSLSDKVDGIAALTVTDGTTVNTFFIKVTAEDGITSAIYQIDVKRLAD